MSNSELARASVTVLVVGFLVLFVGGGSRFAIGLVLKPMTEDLGWSRGTLGAAAAMFLVASAACMFLSGRLADRFSLRLVLCSGLVISALGIGLMSYVSTPWQALLFYGLIFAVGNGLASIAPVGVMVSRWFPGRIGLANAITTSGIGIGQLFIIGALAGVLSDIGWRSGYMWLGIANLMLVPVVVSAMVHKQENAVTSKPASVDAGATLGEATRTGDFRFLVLIYAICGFQDFFVATHVVAFAQERGVDALLAGNLLAVMGLTGVVGVILAGAWCDRTGPQQAMLFCFVLRIAIFSLIVIDQSVISVAAFALAFGITFWLTAPLTVVLARNAFGTANLGAISGLIVMIHHMFGGLGAYIGAAIFDLSGHYDAMFISMLVLSIAASTLCFRLH